VKVALSIPVFLMLTVWAAACIWFDGPESRLFAGLVTPIRRTAIDRLRAGRSRRDHIDPTTLAGMAGVLRALLLRSDLVARNRSQQRPRVDARRCAASDGDLRG